MRPLILRPLFLSSLALLVANDLALKRLAPGFVTGKLSDFAGLFAFVAFFAGCVPRWRIGIGAVTALAFVWFKSPWSEPVLPLLGLTRVVDMTDLIALVVIPFAVHYARDAEPPRLRFATVLISLLSIAAFVATSRDPNRRCCTSTWRFPVTAAQFEAFVQRYPIDPEYFGPTVRRLPASICQMPVLIILGQPAPHGRELDVPVVHVVYNCGQQDRDELAWRALEQHIVRPLGGRRVDRRIDQLREWWRRMKA